MKKSLVVVADLHVGSSTGLCPRSGMALDDGGYYKPSKMQEYLNDCWEHFFGVYVPLVTMGADKRILVINGDAVDGFHHNTVALATNNIMSQERASASLIKDVAVNFDETYFVRGTEAHVQQSAQSDERIAKEVGAIPDSNGDHARWQLWLDLNGVLFNIAHHLGTTSSAAYESSAPMREMVAGLVESGQWNKQMPDFFIRSHRHRYIEISIPSDNDKQITIMVTPAWQLRTPFVEKIDRMRMPHIGGIVINIEDNCECRAHHKVYKLPTQAIEIVKA